MDQKRLPLISHDSHFDSKSFDSRVLSGGCTATGSTGSTILAWASKWVLMIRSQIFKHPWAAFYKNPFKLGLSNI